LTQAQNDLRLQFARRYKSDFEKRYPSILSPTERHAPIFVRGRLWRLALAARHAWPRAGVGFLRSLLKRPDNKE
ncbi:MAG: hypothetical protein NT031_19180, partial [Planctomycetota bacterium]|nr:hypothetical protein [Planctomycetota bacterium]